MRILVWKSLYDNPCMKIFDNWYENPVDAISRHQLKLAGKVLPGFSSSTMFYWSHIWYILNFLASCDDILNLSRGLIPLEFPPVKEFQKIYWMSKIMVKLLHVNYSICIWWYKCMWDGNCFLLIMCMEGLMDMGNYGMTYLNHKNSYYMPLFMFKRWAFFHI